MSIELALIGTGLGLGLRHGVDWDHIAAITDVTGTQPERGKAAILGSLYALGHATVVVILGLAALWAGSTLPSSLDAVMETIVGITLVSLGLWLTYSLFRDGAEFTREHRAITRHAVLPRMEPGEERCVGGLGARRHRVVAAEDERLFGEAAQSGHGARLVRATREAVPAQGVERNQDDANRPLGVASAARYAAQAHEETHRKRELAKGAQKRLAARLTLRF